jgi:NAD(P)-dependent dehydrogenase (short-subunit alcohol dehydrogenase family)
MARRVALVADAGFYVGPSLARLLAASGHDLVLGDPTPELVDELSASVGVAALARPDGPQALVDAALERFGRLDSATAASGRIVVGRFLKSSLDDLRTVVAGCLEAPYLFLKAVLPPMVEHGGGQVLVITSASAARPTPGAPLYSAARAGATHLVRNVADEVARDGVQVNAIGTNFMDFPEFRRANGLDDDPEREAKVVAQVPLGRLGTMEEFAHACLPFVDGTSRFTTGQFLAYAGGWA